MRRFDLKDFFEWPLFLKVIIAILIGLIFFCLGYLWSITELKRQIVEKESQEQEFKQFLKNDIDKKATVEEQIAQSPKLNQLFLEWDKQLVQSSELPDLLNELLKLGSTNRLKILLFQPEQEIKTENSYTKLPIKVAVIGEYDQIATYLSQIANMRWIVVISDFVIAKGNMQNVNMTDKAMSSLPSNQLSAEITLEIYYHNEKATPDPAK